MAGRHGKINIGETLVVVYLDKPWYEKATLVTVVKLLPVILDKLPSSFPSVFTAPSDTPNNRNCVLRTHFLLSDGWKNSIFNTGNMHVKLQFGTLIALIEHFGLVWSRCHWLQHILVMFVSGRVSFPKLHCFPVKWWQTSAELSWTVWLPCCCEQRTQCLPTHWRATISSPVLQQSSYKTTKIHNFPSTWPCLKISCLSELV